MIHLDANFLVDATVPGSPAHADFRAWSAAGESFGVSTIAWAEYLCGPLDPQAEAMAKQIFPSAESLLTSDSVWLRTFSTKPVDVLAPWQIV
jgi:predicted nucleic acid-binding protein